MYENPNKIGRFESRRIRAVENHGGEPRPSQIAIIHRPVEAEYFEASAGMFPLRSGSTGIRMEVKFTAIPSDVGDFHPFFGISLPLDGFRSGSSP
jgi:hypothetical protein